jgi:hypothetical protein
MRRSGRKFSKFHGYAYDAVWAVALAVDHVIRLQDGRYDAANFHDQRFHAALNKTDFIGVTVSALQSLIMCFGAKSSCNIREN